MNTPFWYQLNAFFVKTGLIREDDNDAGQYLYTIPDVNKRWKKNIPPLQSYYFFFTSYCSCNPNYPKDICWDCEVSNRKNIILSNIITVSYTIYDYYECWVN